MRREDCVETFKRIPERLHPQTCVIMQNGATITVDVVFRFDPHFVVLRGREGGSTDEGRGFFIPYEDISYIRIERAMKISDFRKMYGETGFVDEEDKLGQAAEAEVAAKQQLIEAQTPPPTASPLGQQDPASVAKQNLLDRIRAARANATSGKLGNK